MTALQQLHSVTRSSVVLEPIFRLWPIELIQEAQGWAYGSFAVLHSMPHIEVLKRGRLGKIRQTRGVVRELTKAQVQASFLHHEALGNALDTQRLLRETGELYDLPFCDPNPLVSKDRAEIALLRFMQLPLRDPNQAIEFIREFGQFSNDEVDEKGIVNGDVPPEIREFCRRCHEGPQSKRKVPFVLDLREFWDVREKIQGFWDLNTALLKKHIDGARLLCARLRPDCSFPDRANWLAVGRAILCADLSASLNPGRNNPRLILHQKNGKLVLQTVCMNVRVALFFVLLEKVLSGTGYRRCANEDCGMYFVEVRGKKFHSLACQNLAKVRSWRGRQKKTQNR